MTLRARIEDATGLTGAKLVVGAVLALLVLCGVLWLLWTVFVAPRKAREAAATAKVERQVGAKEVATGKDALETVQRVQVAHDRIETITRENNTRILAAPGATDAIPAGVDAAFVASICGRDGRAADPVCGK